jgi:hypothetical protein
MWSISLHYQVSCSHFRCSHFSSSTQAPDARLRDTATTARCRDCISRRKTFEHLERVSSSGSNSLTVKSYAINGGHDAELLFAHWRMLGKGAVQSRCICTMQWVRDGFTPIAEETRILVRLRTYIQSIENWWTSIFRTDPRDPYVNNEWCRLDIIQLRSRISVIQLSDSCSRRTLSNLLFAKVLR